MTLASGGQLGDLAAMTDSPVPDTTGRCGWCGTDPLYVAYHDQEWGVPERDPRALWEKLVLDGFQAGLSWITILKKREAFRAAFDDFDPEKVARYGEADRQRLLNDAGIVRSGAKIDATISGARIWLNLQDQGRDMSDWPSMAQVPASPPESIAMAKALKAEGFKFCGPVIVYAFMQATGMVNDHVTTCHRHAPLSGGQG